MKKKLLFWLFYILKKFVIQLEEKKLASENKNMGLVRPACKKTLRALLCYLNWPQTLTHSSNLFFCVFLFCTNLFIEKIFVKTVFGYRPVYVCNKRERERKGTFFIVVLSVLCFCEQNGYLDGLC